MCISYSVVAFSFVDRLVRSTLLQLAATVITAHYGRTADGRVAGVNDCFFKKKQRAPALTRLTGAACGRGRLFSEGDHHVVRIVPDPVN